MSPPAAAGSSRIRFRLPRERVATEPPERRGLARDAVRLLAATQDGVTHHRFRDLPGLLRPGDVVVVNTSATLPAALDVTDPRGESALLHVAAQLDDGAWVVEPRLPAGDGPDLDAGAGDVYGLPGGASLVVAAPYPVRDARPSRLWTAWASVPVSAPEYLRAHGRPIRYGPEPYPARLAELQNAYAGEPGSAEMASAGRPLTAGILARLVARGVTVAPIVLHAGVSSPELHEPPTPERFAVPAAVARLVNGARDAGERVVAVGTTVVRALESAAGPDGRVRAASGWTHLVLGPERPARVVTGLVTGLHEPEASHLRLLQAVAGHRLVQSAYDAAVAAGYRWHEFGDSMLLLPGPAVSGSRDS